MYQQTHQPFHQKVRKISMACESVWFLIRFDWYLLGKHFINFVFASDAAEGFCKQDSIDARARWKGSNIRAKSTTYDKQTYFSLFCRCVCVCLLLLPLRWYAKHPKDKGKNVVYLPVLFTFLYRSTLFLRLCQLCLGKIANSSYSDAHNKFHVYCYFYQ